MTEPNTEKSEQIVFDPLDMHNYRIEKLPKRKKGAFETWLTYIGPPLAIISFVLFAFILKLPFLQQIDPVHLTENRTSGVFKKQRCYAWDFCGWLNIMDY